LKKRDGEGRREGRKGEGRKGEEENSLLVWWKQARINNIRKVYLVLFVNCEQVSRRDLLRLLPRDLLVRKVPEGEPD